MTAGLRELKEETGGVGSCANDRSGSPKSRHPAKYCGTILVRDIELGEQSLEGNEEIGESYYPLSDVPDLIRTGQITHTGHRRVSFLPLHEDAMSQQEVQKSDTVQPVGYVQLFRQNPKLTILCRASSLFGDWFNILAILTLPRYGTRWGWCFRWSVHRQVYGDPGHFAGGRRGCGCLVEAGDALHRLGKALIVLGMFSVIWFPSHGCCTRCCGFNQH